MYRSADDLGMLMCIFLSIRSKIQHRNRLFMDEFSDVVATCFSQMKEQIRFSTELEKLVDLLLTASCECLFLTPTEALKELCRQDLQHFKRSSLFKRLFKFFEGMHTDFVDEGFRAQVCECIIQNSPLHPDGGGHRDVLPWDIVFDNLQKPPFCGWKECLNLWLSVFVVLSLHFPFP